MTINEILTILKNSGNAKRKQHDIKNGASENTYGILRGELRKLAKQLGNNHELALELWQTANTDAQWLACMLFDAKKLTLDEMRKMVSQVTYSEIIDKFVFEVVSQHKSADILVEDWTVSKEDNLGRAGWDLIVHKISLGKSTKQGLEGLLTTIKTQLQTATPGKQWAMNHALAEIGIRYPEFTEWCIALGETLGVYRELKVSKGCTSAYAPNWIAARIKKRA